MFGRTGEEDEDDHFLAAYRRQRMLQMTSASSLPQYGTYDKVGKFEFVDAINETDPRSYLVIHIYEDYIEACPSGHTLSHSDCSEQ